jgi:hypothetical protein
MTRFIGSEEHRGEAGGVYRFDGYFRNYAFTGTITQVFAASKEN